ncbi:hypothetical protein V5799_030251 [Amblyomma americanum]|uniref:Uncharacterized protein n=1 Tax=Amblyomma americanum TaxID=6943 RepID=A0AAQ4ENP2_AMBAM
MIFLLLYATPDNRRNTQMQLLPTFMMLQPPIQLCELNHLLPLNVEALEKNVFENQRSENSPCSDDGSGGEQRGEADGGLWDEEPGDVDGGLGDEEPGDVDEGLGNAEPGDVDGGLWDKEPDDSAERLRDEQPDNVPLRASFKIGANFLANFSTEKVPNLGTSEAGAIAMTMSFAIAHGLTWTVLGDLATLINNFAGMQVLPRRSYAFRKHWTSRQRDIVSYWYLCDE